MANRPYLALNFSGDPSEEPSAETIVAAGRYSYPILWWSIFEPSDITTRFAVYDEEDEEDEDDEDGEDENPLPVEVPTLITTPALALQRTRARQEILYRYFPATVAPIFQQWQTLLTQLDAPFIQIFTDEIAGMSEPVPTATGAVRFERHFQAVAGYVRAFTEGQIDDWVNLLRQMLIEIDPQTRQLTYREIERGVYRTLTPAEIEADIGYRLRGFAWDRPVPWEDD